MTAAPPRSPGLGLTAAGVAALNLSCKVTWDAIEPEQYCEFRCAPGGAWASAQFSADVVREMRREQFAKYLQTWRDIVEMKEDCGATARTLAERGPPMWIQDSSGFPLPEGQTHVDRLWFMGDGGGRSAAAPAALDGAPMDPGTRGRLAELHRQVYAYFSQASGAAVLPECPPELMDASVCSDLVCNHVRWLQEKFEPMRSAGGSAGVSNGAASATALARPVTPRIGSKIPRKYRQKTDRVRESKSSSGGGGATAVEVAKPGALPALNKAVRPPASRRRLPPPVSPLVRRVHALLYVSAVLASAAAVVLLYRTLGRGPAASRIRQALGLSGLRGGQATASAPTVEDFLSRLPQWAAAPAQPRPVPVSTAPTAGSTSAARRIRVSVGQRLRDLASAWSG